MQGPDDIRRTQARRFAYLKYLYTDWSNVPSGGIQSKPARDAFAALGLNEQEGDRIHEYVEMAGLAKTIGAGPLVEITRLGIDTVEAALANPDQKTSSYFPPVDNLDIETASTSQIQQGTTQRKQAGRWAATSGGELRKLTDEIRSAFGSLSLPLEHRQDVDAHIGTLDAQTRANQPNHAIVRESLSSLRSIAEKAGAMLLAGKLAGILSDAAEF
jgi:hypothetical protein